MSWAKEFIELEKAIHDRASFDCGEVELNEFIRTKAAKHMTAGISRTMVLRCAKTSEFNRKKGQFKVRSILILLR